MGRKSPQNKKRGPKSPNKTVKLPTTHRGKTGKIRQKRREPVPEKKEKKWNPRELPIEQRGTQWVEKTVGGGRESRRRSGVGMEI